MNEATISAGYPRALADFAAGLGAARSKLFECANIEPAQLEAQDNRVPLSSFLRMLAAAAKACGDPALGLHFGQAIDMQDVSIVGLIGASCETVGEGREQMNRYAKLIIDDGAPRVTEPLQLVRQDSEVWMLMTNPVFALHPHLTEMMLAQCILGARRLFAGMPYFQSTLFPHTIHLAYAPPAYWTEYERVFNVPIAFGCDWTGFRIDDDFLSIRIPPRNRYVFGVLSEKAEALLRELESARSVRAHVERMLIPVLHKGDTGIDQIAALMGMSRATLYRRLKAEGVTFEQVLDELRHRMALHYLDGRKVSVNETAYLVGFSEPSAFSRAFKRWTGKSPSETRPSDKSTAGAPTAPAVR